MEGRRCFALGHHHCSMYDFDMKDKEGCICANQGKFCVESEFVSEQEYQQHSEKFKEFRRNYNAVLSETRKLIASNIDCSTSSPSGDYVITISTRKVVNAIVEKFRPKDGKVHAMIEEQRFFDKELELKNSGIPLQYCINVPELTQSLMEKYLPDLKWESPLKLSKNEKFEEFLKKREEEGKYTEEELRQMRVDLEEKMKLKVQSPDNPDMGLGPSP